ncbi:MAG: Carbon monoxide dehydrogenase medium chain [Alphaproteobacteria bacterium MarineAlpha3_Bin5]|nr:carbon monoxide dehydrogenase [Magnetovibrio sp.]PPR76978.1 MAG: Carbon monoxide dehydrogenase medium chain [Alphaproteobacteria bacterium MarineAlpha3_Bin5]
MINFSFQKPTSITDAVTALSKSEDGLFLAGGQTLIPVLKQRLAMPCDIIDLGDINDLKGIVAKKHSVLIGATTTHSEVEASPVVREHIPALAELAGHIGDPHVRNLGTLGGSLANNDPSADYPAAVLGLGATIHTNQRSISSDEFFVGLFQTALDPGEMIVRVEFPIPEKSGYAKFPNPASRYAIVGVFVSSFSGSVRVSVTGAESCVFRQVSFEEALAEHFAIDALTDFAVPSDRFNSDLHASAEYRAQLVRVMACRAIIMIDEEKKQ